MKHHAVPSAKAQRDRDFNSVNALQCPPCVLGCVRVVGVVRGAQGVIGRARASVVFRHGTPQPGEAFHVPYQSREASSSGY